MKSSFSAQFGEVLPLPHVLRITITIHSRKKGGAVQWSGDLQVNADIVQVCGEKKFCP